MNARELRVFLRAQLLELFDNRGLTGVLVIASNQPTTEGREDGPAIYFHQLDEQREGWQGRTTKRLDDDSAEITESQILATTFQVSCVCPETENPGNPLASDICRAASMALQSRQFVDALGQKEKGAGVRRVTAIRSPYTVNDQGQFEMVPNFDVTITHTITSTDTVEAVKRAEANFYRV